MTGLVSTIDITPHRWQVDFVLGHPKNMVSWDWLENKLNTCSRYSAVKISEGNLKQMVAICKSLDEASDATAIVRLMTPHG